MSGPDTPLDDAAMNLLCREPNPNPYKGSDYCHKVVYGPGTRCSDHARSPLDDAALQAEDRREP